MCKQIGSSSLIKDYLFPFFSKLLIDNKGGLDLIIRFNFRNITLLSVIHCLNLYIFFLCRDMATRRFS